MPRPEDIVDTCGTGGDRSRSINVSTIAALVVAGAGARVCKHGGRAASSAAGSADVLEALGVVIDLGPVGVARCIEEVGIGFCFAPRFHPAMRFAIPVRRELGVATVFNFLGPLANPARARLQVVGVSDPAMADKMLGVLVANGCQRAMVVHGADGLDELSTTGPSTVLDVGADAEVRRYTVDPTDLGLARGLARRPARRRRGCTTRTWCGASWPGRRARTATSPCSTPAAGLVVAGLSVDLADGSGAGRCGHRRRRCPRRPREAGARLDERRRRPPERRCASKGQPGPRSQIASRSWRL